MKKNLKFEIPFKIIIFIFIFIFIFNLIINHDLLFSNKIRKEYKSYYNIKINVTDYNLSGKLDNHTTINYKSNKCYIKYCGMLQNGVYELSEIQFIYLNKEPFILKICTKRNECFYNLSSKLIEEIKENKIKDIKFNLLWGLIFILISVANYTIMKRIISKRITNYE